MFSRPLFSFKNGGLMDFYSINEIPVKVHGRTVEGACPLPLFWNHAGVEVNVAASELWIELSVDCGFHEPWIAVELNGALMSRQMLLPGEHSLCLFRSMTPDVVKNVKFYRELQAMSEDDRCHILVKGFKTDGKFFPVEDKKLKLEFIGDSITSGEGTYGATTDTDWLAMYMSSSRHYASIIEKSLDADARIISQGGWGVFCGWDNDVRHNIPSVYEPVCGLATGEFNEKLGASKPYDFSSWVPDAIIVNLGTNDDTAFGQPPLEIPGMGTFKQRRNEDGSYNAEDIKKVEDAIVNFLKMLRKHNPTSHIVWVYGMLGYGLTLPITDAMNRYRNETGDTNTAFINLPNTIRETFGAHMHPGYAAHIEAAKVLGEYLAARFNIPVKEVLGNL